MLLSFIKQPLIRFVSTFILFFVSLYYFIIFYEGITAQGGYYISFLDHYLNFIDWYRILLLYSAHFLTNLMGFQSTIPDHYHLHIIHGYSVQLVYSCLGFGLLSVWFAFLIAYPSNIYKKIIWAIYGLLLISFLNIIRIAVLAIVVTKIKKTDIEIHHTIYNIVVYICIVIMIYFYTKEKNKTY